MAEVEYVYEKPRGIRSHKRLIIILVLVIIAVISAYLLYTNIYGSSAHNQTFVVGGNTYTIPSGLKGADGLQYIKNNYASDLEQATGLCRNNFKGSWTDTSTAIGCYNMQGFSYCGTEDIRSLTNMCSSIGGTPFCDSTRVSCGL